MLGTGENNCNLHGIFSGREGPAPTNTPSLRGAKRGRNPAEAVQLQQSWIASSLPLLAMTVALLMFLFSATACGNAEGIDWLEGDIFVEIPSPTPFDESLPHSFTPPIVESPVEFLPFLIPAGPISRLTGLPIEDEYVNRRPFAAVINNSSRALPQSGVGAADIIYEVLAEGDVTRLVGIFQSYIPEMIGPMRSARDYFIDFAFNHGAVFVHHGASTSGYARINSLSATNLDGMALEGTVFWRDRSFPEWTGNTGRRAIEHSSFTGNERLLNHVANRGIRDYWPEDAAGYGFNFTFAPQAEQVGGQAYMVHVPFSALYWRRFEFDPETGLYMAENRQGPHMDANTGEPVGTSTILIQFTSMRVIDGVGRRAVDTIGSGSGYMISGGRYQPILWAKDSHTAPTRWYFADGTPLQLAPGRVWICVFQSNGNVVFE